MAKETENIIIEPRKLTSEAELPSGLSAEMDKILESDTVEEQVVDKTEKEEEKKTEEKADDTEQAETEEAGSEESEPEGDEDEEDIDQRLVNAGRRRGYSDEKIIKLAEENPGVLEDIADLYDNIDNTSGSRRTEVSTSEPPPKKVVDELKKLELKSLDEEALAKLSSEFGADVVEKVIRPLSDNVKTVSDALDKIQGSMAEQTTAQQEDVLGRKSMLVNQICDDASETFKVFGTFSKLPKDADGNIDVTSQPFRARMELFETALAFESTGIRFETALEEAFNWFKGKYGEAETARKLVHKLNKNRKRMSPRPTKKHTVKKYDSKEAKAEGEMEKIYNDLGIEA